MCGIHFPLIHSLAEYFHIRFIESVLCSSKCVLGLRVLLKLKHTFQDDARFQECEVIVRVCWNRFIDETDP